MVLYMHWYRLGFSSLFSRRVVLCVRRCGLSGHVVSDLFYTRSCAAAIACSFGDSISFICGFIDRIDANVMN
jgi:hypothetical protein